MSRQELLASVPLFESLTEDDLATLTNRFEEEAVETGEPVFQQGDDGSSLYIIEDGEVEISYGSGHSRVVLASLFPGQYFGELSLFDGSPRSATATATKRSSTSSTRTRRRRSASSPRWASACARRTS